MATCGHIAPAGVCIFLKFPEPHTPADRLVIYSNSPDEESSFRWDSPATDTST